MSHGGYLTTAVVNEHAMPSVIKSIHIDTL